MNVTKNNNNTPDGGDPRGMASYRATAATERAASDPGPLSLPDQRAGPIDPYMQVPGGVLHVPEQHSAPDVHGAPERKQQVQGLVPAG